MLAQIADEIGHTVTRYEISGPTGMSIPISIELLDNIAARVPAERAQGEKKADSERGESLTVIALNGPPVSLENRSRRK